MSETSALHNGALVVDESPTATAQEMLAGVERVYSTSEAAKFFGKSNQWLYWGMRNNIFTQPSGATIEPERIGKGGRRRFTLPVIRDIALSCYRRGNLKEPELKDIMVRIARAEQGEELKDIIPMPDPVVEQGDILPEALVEQGETVV